GVRCQRLHDVSHSDHTHDEATLAHGHVMDASIEHLHHDVEQRVIYVDADVGGGHHGADGVVKATTGSDDATTQIVVGDDAKLVGAHDKYAGEASLRHELCSFTNTRLSSDGERRTRQQ